MYQAVPEQTSMILPLSEELSREEGKGEGEGERGWLRDTQRERDELGLMPC